MNQKERKKVVKRLGRILGSIVAICILAAIVSGALGIAIMAIKWAINRAIC